MGDYTSRQAARKLGISAPTLSNYINVGKIPRPKSVTVGGITIYVWTEEDIERVRQLLPTIANGRKTRYKKKQSAIGSQQSAIGSQQSAKPKATPKAKKRSKP